MAKFVFSAFADEIASDFDQQIASLKKLGIGLLELRGVDGKSFVDLSDSRIITVKNKLSDAGISLSALGSPLGKTDADCDMNAQTGLLMRLMDIGDELGCKRIRMFSYYKPLNMSKEDFKSRVFDNIERLLELSENRGFVLCHENEKDIFGWNVKNELELLDHFGGRLKAVLDPGNFAFCRTDASTAYPTLKDHIEYFHIKDADETGAIVPPGKGVACLEEIIRSVAEDRPEKEVILTMEPHLMNFTGLSSLSKLDDIRHKYTFETPFAAFEFAYSAVKEMVDRIESDQ